MTAARWGCDYFATMIEGVLPYIALKQCMHLPIDWQAPIVGYV